MTFRSLSASESWRAVALALAPGAGHSASGLGEEEEEAAHSDGFMSWRLRQKAATCSVLYGEEGRQKRKKQREIRQKARNKQDDRREEKRREVEGEAEGSRQREFVITLSCQRMRGEKKERNRDKERRVRLIRTAASARKSQLSPFSAKPEVTYCTTHPGAGSPLLSLPLLLVRLDGD